MEYKFLDEIVSGRAWGGRFKFWIGKQEEELYLLLRHNILIQTEVIARKWIRPDYNFAGEIFLKTLLSACFCHLFSEGGEEKLVKETGQYLIEIDDQSLAWRPSKSQFSGHFDILDNFMLQNQNQNRTGPMEHPIQTLYDLPVVDWCGEVEERWPDDAVCLATLWHRLQPCPEPPASPPSLLAKVLR